MDTTRSEQLATKFTDFYNEEILKEVISPEGVFYGITVNEFLYAFVLTVKAILQTQQSVNSMVDIIFLQMYMQKWAMDIQNPPFNNEENTGGYL